MISHRGFAQMKDLINATYNLDNYTLIQDFRHVAFVGRAHFLALHGCITEAAEKEMDFTKLGRDLLATGSGIVTDYGMLFPNEGNMPKQTDCPCLGDKFTSAAWTVDTIKRSLYGRVDIRLHEELTEKEEADLRTWITEQNKASCERIEGQPIDSEDGILAISLWHGGNDYFVWSRDELDEYIEQQNDLKIGGM